MFDRGASFREAAASLSGKSDFVVTGVAGVPVAALERLAFLWELGSFAPAVTGTALVDDGSGEIAQVLGVDPGGDGAVREMKLSGDARLSTLLAPDTVFVPEAFARRHGLAAGKTLRIVVGGARRVVKVEEGLNRSSRKEQLIGMLERAGFDVNGALASESHVPGLRMAGS